MSDTKTLVAEVRAIEATMTPGPWRYSGLMESIFDARGEVALSVDSEHGGNGAGVAFLRNNALSLAAALEQRERQLAEAHEQLAHRQGCLEWAELDLANARERLDFGYKSELNLQVKVTEQAETIAALEARLAIERPCWCGAGSVDCVSAACAEARDKARAALGGSNAM